MTKRKFETGNCFCLGIKAKLEVPKARPTTIQTSKCFVIQTLFLEDIEEASDDEKGQMLQLQHHQEDHFQSNDDANVPLQSRQEDEM